MIVCRGTTRPTLRCPGVACGGDLRRGLIGYWPFTEGAGSVLQDRSGDRNHAAISGAVWVAGKSGPGLRFNGSNQYAQSATMRRSLHGGRACTVIAIGTPSETPSGYHQIISLPHDSAGTNGVDLWFNNTMAGGTVQTSATYLSRTSSTTIAVGVRYLFGLTYDGNTLIPYLNGVAGVSGTLPLGTGIIHNSKTIQFGRFGTLGNYWGGVIELAAVWNRALSAGEIRAIAADPSIFAR